MPYLSGVPKWSRLVVYPFGPLWYLFRDAGQITTITSLTTSADTSTTTTDHTSTFDTPLTANANLKYGLSLMSYESWMTDTFSFNISMVDYSNTSVTVRFLVLDNTFFTRAKVHYIIVWWPGTYPNDYLSSPPVLPPNTYNCIDVLFGCKFYII
jgi:hypothetical protein